MKELRIEELYSPEYYFELPEHDCRIAIMKFHDAKDTMGMADLSLSYIKEEPTEDVGRIFARTVYLRHAIEDLHSSFDLLMQIPWFFYRIWEHYNPNGDLRERRLKNYNDIERNSDRWVYKAEQECRKNKVLKYLHSTDNPMEQKINDFWEKYMENGNKPFTIHGLCNAIKHNHPLQFEELYTPYDFFININGKKVNLRENGVGLVTSQRFHTSDETISGTIKYRYSNDLSVDYEYTNGDYFRFEDCNHSEDRIKISDVYKECCEFYDGLVDLFEDIYNDIYPQLLLFESFLGKDGKPNITKGSSISMNDYFTTA